MIIMLLLALMALPMSAQRPIKYQVKRGETLASIAKKFGMTENELKRMNDDLSYCYAGMLILVRDKRGDSRDDDYYEDDGGDYADDRVNIDAPAVPFSDPLIDEARMLEERGEFKKAVKCYDKLLDRGPSAPLFYSRGVCYFQMKKWKKSIEDFERVTRSNDASSDLIASSEDYIDEAYMRWDEAKERSTNTWAGIVAGAVAIGAVADALSGPSNSSKSNKGGHDNKRNGKDRPSGKQGQAQGKQGAPPKGGAVQGGKRGGEHQSGTRPGGNRNDNKPSTSQGSNRKPNAVQGNNRGGGDRQQGTRPSGNRDGSKPNAGQGGNRGNRPNASQGGSRGGDRPQGSRQNGNRRDREDRNK